MPPNCWPMPSSTTMRACPTRPAARRRWTAGPGSSPCAIPFPRRSGQRSRSTLRRFGFGTPRDLGFMPWDIDHAARRCCSALSCAPGCWKFPPRQPGDPATSLRAALVRAYDRLPDRPPFGYSTEKIGFCVVLNPDGSVAHVEDPRDTGKKRSPRRLMVPQARKRSVGIDLNMLWDKTAYVPGVTAGKGKRTGAGTCGAPGQASGMAGRYRGRGAAGTAPVSGGLDPRPVRPADLAGRLPRPEPGVPPVLGTRLSARPPRRARIVVLDRGRGRVGCAEICLVTGATACPSRSRASGARNPRAPA